jgi:hypothetical protein
MYRNDQQDVMIDLLSHLHQPGTKIISFLNSSHANALAPFNLDISNRSMKMDSTLEDESHLHPLAF